MNFKSILIIFCLVASASLYAQKSITNEDIWRSVRFYATGVNGINSMNDGLHYTSLESSQGDFKIVKYSYESGESLGLVTSKTEIKSKTGTKISFKEYAFSADEKKILLTTQKEKIYRHSSRALFYIYDLEAEKLSLLDDEKVRYATFSPAGDKVAFVKGNNLFIKNLSDNLLTQITTDGEKNKIINGATDWVYEEEFAMDKAFYWSPDGKHIAYYRFDESDVNEFSMDVYGKGLYPHQEVFKYPKAGEANSVVTAHIYSLDKNISVQVLADADYEYITKITWMDDPNYVVINAMNRHQNHIVLHKINVMDGSQTVLYEEKDEAYIEINKDLHFLKDGSFIWLSYMDGFNHLYHIDKKGKIKTQITKGNWDVYDFYGVDEKSGKLFYQSNEEHTSEKNVYSISLKGKNKKRLSPEKGTNKAEFSVGHKYFINTHSSYNSPPYVSLMKANGTQIRVLKDNQKKKDLISTYKMTNREFFTLKTEAGIELSAWKMLPSDFDSTKKYPVLMFVYGGPGSQKVLNQYNAYNDMWYQLLCNNGYMIVCVDNRGTGGKGRDFKKMTYLELGKYEVEDQIASAKYLATLPYVDAARIGIWGWSYGGFMSANCLFKGNDVFKTAIAVAPVTNWRFYDNIYTERYMRTPQENENGYEENSPINHVKKLKGNFLLVHGTADDNVHVQNSMRMAFQLVQANKEFDYFVYPDKNHSILGNNAKLHLYKKMTAFIFENL